MEHGPFVKRGLKQSPFERIGLWRSAPPAHARNSSNVAALATASVGTAAVGALAFGAVAVGALAIRRLFVARARVRSIVIDELIVNKLTVRDAGARAFEPVGQGAVASGEEAVANPASSRGNGAALHPVTEQLSPGDEAASGTPGTGEQTCPVCGGSGLIDSQRCENCAGSGKVTQGIGGG
jgi:hypothetical protein